jgi:GTP cyclohydrolase II
VFHNEVDNQSVIDQQRKTQRNVGVGAQILHDLKIRRVRLLTNRPHRVAGLEGYDIEIVEPSRVSPDLMTEETYASRPVDRNPVLRHGN